MLRPDARPRGAARPSEMPSGSCLARWEPSCDRSRPPPQSGSTRRGTLLQPPCGNATTTTVSSETIANCIALDAISSRTRIGGPRQERTRVVDKEKDWEKEMAEVDRLLKKLPYGEPTPSASSAPTVRNTPAVAPPGADLTAAGQWVPPATDDYFENRNPADWNDLIGLFPKSGPEDVRRAVESARRGFAEWSRTPAPVRGEVLHRVGDLLVEHKNRIARAMTREMGKVVLETKGDVQEGIDTAYYAHTEGRRLFGRTVPSELRNKWAMTYRRPIGVAGALRC